MSGPGLGTRQMNPEVVIFIKIFQKTVKVYPITLQKANLGDSFADHLLPVARIGSRGRGVI
ncbi:MAG: hypothetical protein EA395_07195 [Phormidium sp. GEM2.Bin31]|nr:MAG: hypothetical protein EA395_07195 [Phormidium sp. GEM2.Bin31]